MTIQKCYYDVNRYIISLVQALYISVYLQGTTHVLLLKCGIFKDNFSERIVFPQNAVVFSLVS